MEEEESEVFERAKKVIGEEHNEGFGKDFETRKKEERGLIAKKREDSLED